MLTWHIYAKARWCGAVGSDEEWWWCGQAWAARRKEELTSGASETMRGEGGGDEIGRRKPKGKTHFHEGANGTWARWAGWVKRRPAEKRWASSADSVGPRRQFKWDLIF
jgi:hypothetical protein